jgi:hypothetical protein
MRPTSRGCTGSWERSGIELVEANRPGHGRRQRAGASPGQARAPQGQAPARPEARRDDRLAGTVAEGPRQGGAAQRPRGARPGQTHRAESLMPSRGWSRQIFASAGAKRRRGRARFCKRSERQSSPHTNMRHDPVSSKPATCLRVVRRSHCSASGRAAGSSGLQPSLRDLR